MEIKTCYLRFLLLFVVFQTNAQKELEYYQSILDTTTIQEHKLDVLDSMIALTTEINPKLMANYGERFVDLALSLNHFDLAADRALDLFNPINAVLNDPDRGIALIERILPYESKIEYSYIKGELYQMLGSGYANGKDLKKSIESYNDALIRFTDSDSLEIADTHFLRGESKSFSGDYFGALKDYQISYEIYENHEERRSMLNSQQGIITIYSLNGFFDNARIERQKLFNEAETLNLNNLLFQEHFSQSIDNKKQGLIKEQETELLTALNYLDNQSTLLDKATLYGELADFYGEQNDLIKSKKYLDLIENDLKKDVLIDNSIRITYYLAKANYLKNIGDYDKALAYALQKKRIEKRYDSKEDIMDTHELLANIYEKNGDINNSLKYSKKYNQLKDSLYNVTKSNALIFYQTLYETEKKEKEIFEKNMEITLLERDNDNFRRQIILGGIGLSSLFFLILVARNRRHLKKANILQEKYTQDLLDSQEYERQRVSKDLHDSIGQSLLLIKNKIVPVKDPETNAIVESAIEEVRTISKALHPFQIKELGLTQAIHKRVAQVDKATDLFISCEIDTIDGLLQESQEVHVYRLIQESLNNVIKHSSAKAARIEITAKNNQISIMIKDNGIGFDYAKSLKEYKSLGLKTLMERTKFLNGNLTVDSEKNKGTTLEFQIPSKC